MPHRLGQAPQGQATASTNVYVASLPTTYTDQQLFELLAPYGTITSARVMCDSKTGQCKGYGFVLYENDASAAFAIQGLSGHAIEGHRIQVRLAHLAASPVANRAESTTVTLATQPPPTSRLPSFGMLSTTTSLSPFARGGPTLSSSPMVTHPGLQLPPRGPMTMAPAGHQLLSLQNQVMPQQQQCISSPPTSSMSLADCAAYPPSAAYQQSAQQHSFPSSSLSMSTSLTDNATFSSASYQQQMLQHHSLPSSSLSMSTSLASAPTSSAAYTTSYAQQRMVPAEHMAHNIPQHFPPQQLSQLPQHVNAQQLTYIPQGNELSATGLNFLRPGQPVSLILLDQAPTHTQQAW